MARHTGVWSSHVTQVSELHGFVPTKLCLYNKRIANDSHCPRCHVANEDVSHALRHCAFARNVWLAFHYGCPNNDESLYHEGVIQGVRDVVTFVHGYCSELDVLVPKQVGLMESSSGNISLIWEAKGLSRAFLECRFAFLERFGNQFAHAVAQEGILRLEDSLWVEEALLLATTLVVVVDRRLFDPP
ncbi:hypothetical protein Goklo_025166 [Gossypium klotzschianum]|uniref:Reverse transcriptase zinc-binding domain-containing protein n=1 Tax=Gossypium klotzschianum TaxID=34286 RepID=A0A7J8W515_9ROSI|nr:hypothetical protein [Gossypium klotzschianum]